MKHIYLNVIDRYLSIVAQWRYMAAEIWVSIGSDNGLLPDQASHTS